MAWSPYPVYHFSSDRSENPQFAAPVAAIGVEGSEEPGGSSQAGSAWEQGDGGLLSPADGPGACLRINNLLFCGRKHWFFSQNSLLIQEGAPSAGSSVLRSPLVLMLLNTNRMKK
jgi:hypothetical protein